jgi:hypothetical protein
MVSSKLAAGAAFAGLILFAAPAFADPSDCVVNVHMKRGTDSIEYTGRLTHAHESCDYHFKARAGQTLTWTLQGPATRQTIGYPDGNGDGPGIPQSIPLQQTGEYVFGVSADLMAEGAFGRYRRRLTIR